MSFSPDYAAVGVNGGGCLSLQLREIGGDEWQQFGGSWFHLSAQTNVAMIALHNPLS